MRLQFPAHKEIGECFDWPGQSSLEGALQRRILLANGWGGAHYFGAAGVRDEVVVGFNSEVSPLWSVCEDPGLVPRFIAEPGFMATNLARRIEFPWADGDKMIRKHVPDWSGYAIWGDPTNRNVGIKFHARPEP